HLAAPVVLLDCVDVERATDARARGNGCRKADAVEAVVERHAVRLLLVRDDLVGHRRQQREGQIAVRDRAAERGLRRPLGIDVDDRRRGLAVWHDHFVGLHGGAIVLDVRSDEELALLDDPGPLEGWRLSVHPLTFSLSAVGFAAQTSFTLEEYRGVSLGELAA